MNYATLFETIKGYTENDFPNTQYTDSSGTLVNFTSKEQIDIFIQQAEQKIYNVVQFPPSRKNVTLATNTSDPYMSAPADFLAVYSMAVIDGTGNYEYLINKDVNFIRASYPNPAEEDIPRYYALFGPSPIIPNELIFIFGPTPDAVYNIELHYFFYPESIVTAGTTWLGDNFEMALLYGSLLEAYTYMKGEPDVIANYEKRYQEAITLAQRLGDGFERSDAYRSGQLRYPVS